MRIYNTLTRRKEELKTITPGEVKIYACGPTVYNYIHIGNSRPLCVFDTLRRYLEYRGYKVNFVQNFTDIDDKIIKKAIEENSDYKTVSEKYIKEFWTDAKGLNFREATVHPKATENIDEIINIITTLVEKGYAYPVENGDVYFSPKKFSGYGKLSHQPLEELEAGARINIGELKREPMDFALWKGAKPGEPYWESPWARADPAGISSALQWFIASSEIQSIFTAAVRILSSRTMKTKSHSPSAATAFRSHIIGCTTDISMLTTLKCQNLSAISLQFVM